MSTTAKTMPAQQPGQYLTMPIRASVSDGGSLKISGIANHAGVTDSYNTKIRFNQRALDGFMSNPILLWGHDTNAPIGKVTRMYYQGDELHAEAEVHPDARTPYGASVTELVKAGVLRAFSVRFDDYTEKREKDYTMIEAGALDELSIVTLPSNKASLFAMRSKGVTLHGAEELLTEPRVLDARTADTRAAGPLDVQLLSSRLYAAVQALETDDWWGCGLVSVYDEFCVYCDYSEGRYYRLGYSVDADGNVALTGTAQEIIPAWHDVNASAADEPMRSITENDMGAIVGEVLMRVRAQLGLDQTGEPVLHAGAIRNALNPPETPPSEPETPVSAAESTETPPVTEEPVPTLEDVRSALRSAAQQVNSAPPG